MLKQIARKIAVGATLLALANPSRPRRPLRLARIQSQELFTRILAPFLVWRGKCSHRGLAHSYFGVCRESPAFIVLSHLRMAVYLACVNYWIISLWRKEQRVRTMTPEMREKVFTLQMRLKYDLEDLRSRKEL